VSISHITIEASMRFASTYFIVKCGEILSYKLLNSVWVPEAWIKGKAHNFLNEGKKHRRWSVDRLAMPTF
jgi:hypothetical protein